MFSRGSLDVLEFFPVGDAILISAFQGENGGCSLTGGLNQEAEGVFGVKGRSVSPSASTTCVRSQKDFAPVR